MSLINEYRATEEAIKELQERLKNLSQDDKLQKELEFEGKLRALMAEYQKSLPSIIAILDHFSTLCTDLTSGLPAEIEARQKQYEYYRDNLLSFTPAD